VIAWAWAFFPLPFLYTFLGIQKLPPIGPHFGKALLVSGSLLTVASILYIKAIKASDLSVTVPMLTFTPLFMLVTSPLILGEFPRPLGLLGILFIVAGSYLLNFKDRHKGYLVPFKSLVKIKGPRYMLVVALLYSIGSNVDKIGVQNSSPIFWVIAINIFLTVAMFPIMIYKSRRNLQQISPGYKALFPIGLASALTLIFQMTAINLVLVTYVISIKRTSAIMGVLFGYLIFKEKGIKERLVGVLIMIIGVIFIAFS